MNKKFKFSLISFVAVVTIIAGSVFAAATSGKGLPVAEKKKAMSPGVVKEAQYVGSGACKSCHEKEFTEWAGTWHANMHRKLTPDIVKADFNNVEITYSEIEIETADKKKVKISPTIRLDKEGDRFTMTLIDKDNPANNQVYPVIYVLGGNWNQHFEARVGDMHFPTPMRWEVSDGQWLVKPFNDIWWVADGTADGRPKRPEEMPKMQTGDAKCDACHTTGFKATKNTVTGTWTGNKAEVGIACEKCHGPGATKKAKDHWDVSSHSFSAVMPHTADDFKMRSSCNACHKGEDKEAKGLIMLSRQKEVKTKMEAVRYAIAQYETKGQRALESRDLINAVILDKSMGVHNYTKAMTILEDAQNKLK